MEYMIALSKVQKFEVGVSSTKKKQTKSFLSKFEKRLHKKKLQTSKNLEHEMFFSTKIYSKKISVRHYQKTDFLVRRTSSP